MRVPRQLKENVSYHVTARANRQEFIFESDSIKELFLDVLKAAKKRYKFKIINFCIMGNHVHIMIKPLHKSDLSKIMQWVLSVFAVKFNKINGFYGHVWYDRFKSTIIETLRHFLTVFEYINNNPVKAGMVEKPEDYFYCGITFLKNKVYEIVDPPDSIFN